MPKHPHTYGNDASELSTFYGFQPDPWQDNVLCDWLGVDENGKFTSTSCGLSVPRQNGKNALLEIRELYGMTCPEEGKPGEKILHTAHEVKTARKAFLRLCSFFENERQYPELAEMVKYIRRTNGQEAIELINGGSIEFSARSRGAARGFTVDTVVFDEAQELTDEQLDALLPTLAAAPNGNRQFIYTGTPPTPNSPGEVFSRIRKTAIENLDDKLTWHEWSVEKLPRKDTPLEELTELAYTTNPAMGYRLTPDFTQKEALTMSIDGFARERLGWWSPLTAVERPISPTLWAETEYTDEDIQARISFGVKFAPDGLSYALSGCKSNKEKSIVELIEIDTTELGTKELAKWLYERRLKACCVVIDGLNGADALCDHLGELGVPKNYVIRPHTKDVISGSSLFIDGLKTKSLFHVDDEDLNQSALRSIRRPIGKNGAWAFGSTEEASSIPIESCVLAYWGAKNTKRNPKRKQRLL